MKHNLAKVLGLEQRIDERVTFNPTEDQIQQSQAEEFHQYLDYHKQATEVSLEAVSSAYAFGSVIQKNNSTDKTTYELLKVAVEQLKEKTGVKARSVALESISKANYKTEALEGIKDFIVKVIKAIKDAFFSMVDKVKAFFKTLFDRNKAIEKEADEIAKDAAKLDTISSSENDNSFVSEETLKYIGSYSGIDRDALTTIKDFKKKVTTAFNTISRYTYEAKYPESPIDGPFKIHPVDIEDGELIGTVFPMGRFEYVLFFKDNKLDLDVTLARNPSGISADYIQLKDIRDVIPAQIKDLISEINKRTKAMDQHLVDRQEWIKNDESYFASHAQDFEGRQEELKALRENFNDIIEYVKSCIAAHAKLCAFLHKTCSVFLTYMREYIDNVKSRSSHNPQ